jgi:ADP-ribose pyrophosphatase
MTTNRPIVPREIRKVYTGRIFTVQVETIALPKGGEMNVEVVRHPGSVVLVPITDAGGIILVRQYRHAIGRWAWELPAGSLQPGEDIEQAAIRELHEEVGLIAGHLEKLGALFPTPGYCDEEMHMYRATGLREPHDGDAPAHQDEDEDIEVQTFPLQALRHMISSGEIIDLKTIAGLSLVSLG